jgi:AcrR family transcriptional regulator
MARTQAADYEQRRGAILDRAAELYARKGFRGASLSDLAAACSTSKSLIYHYYSSKDDILFDVMRSHVDALLVEAEAVAASDAAPDGKLRRLSRAFLALYAGAAARHRVLLNELDQLTPERRDQIIGVQRRLIAIVEGILAGVQPRLGPAHRRPTAMLFFGMINWTHTWLRPDGPVSPAEIADLGAALFLDGLRQMPT